MNERQKAFADYYVELGNAEQAAIKAGYSERYARGNAHKLVAHSCIKEYIDKRLKQKEDERIASQDEVLKYLTSVMRQEKIEEVVVVEGEGDGCSSARIVKKHVGIKDANKAAELLAKRYGLLTENVNLSGDINVTIVDDVPKEDDEA